MTFSEWVEAHPRRSMFPTVEQALAALREADCHSVTSFKTLRALLVDLSMRQDKFWLDDVATAKLTWQA